MDTPYYFRPDTDALRLSRVADLAPDPEPKPPAVSVDGRLRPYRDVRAAFEPWRRLALAAWSRREERPRAQPSGPTVH